MKSFRQFGSKVDVGSEGRKPEGRLLDKAATTSASQITSWEIARKAGDRYKIAKRICKCHQWLTVDGGVKNALRPVHASSRLCLPFTAAAANLQVGGRGSGCYWCYGGMVWGIEDHFRVEMSSFQTIDGYPPRPSFDSKFETLVAFFSRTWKREWQRGCKGLRKTWHRRKTWLQIFKSELLCVRRLVGARGEVEIRDIIANFKRLT